MTPLVQLLPQLETTLKAAGRSPETIRGYVGNVRRALCWIEAQIGCPVTGEALTTERLHAFLAHRPYRPNSLKHQVSALTAFGGLLPQDPTRALKRPRVPKGTPRYLPREEIDRIIEAPRARPRRAHLDVIDLRDAAILQLLYEGATRIGESMAIDVDDLVVEEDVVYIHVAHGKGGKQRQALCEGKAAVAAFRDYLARRQELYPRCPALFLSYRGGRRLRAPDARVALQKWARRVGLLKRIYPHLFRHSKATHMMEDGADLRAIQVHLGHESLAVTETYLHLDMGRRREAARPRQPAAPRAAVVPPRPADLLRRGLRQLGAAALAWLGVPVPEGFRVAG